MKYALREKKRRKDKRKKVWDIFEKEIRRFPARGNGMNKENTSLFQNDIFGSGFGSTGSKRADGGQLTSPSSMTIILALRRLYLVGNVLGAVSEPVSSFHCFRMGAHSAPLSRILTSMRSASPASAHEAGIGTLLIFFFVVFGVVAEISSVSTDDFILFLDGVAALATLCSRSGLIMFVGDVAPS